MALRFAELKANLVLWDVNAEGNDATANEAQKFGVRVLTYKVDLSSREEIYKAAAQVRERA